MRPFRRSLSLGLLFSCLSGIICPLWAADWVPIAEGLEYKKLERSGRQPYTVHAIRVDPRQYRLDLVTPKSASTLAMTANDYRTTTASVMVINGGFFDENGKSLGLMVQSGQLLQPVRPVDWGIFIIEDGVPKIVHRDQFVFSDKVSMALQVGPRLVVNGRRPKFKESLPSRRSLVAIDREGRVIFAVTGSSLLTTDRFATVAVRGEKVGGLGAVDALNLDGGGSSQLTIKTDSFELSIPGEIPVPNGIGVFAKSP